AKMSKVLGNGHITGVDFSEDAVQACAKRFDSLIRAGFIDLHCANVAELPFHPGTFTKVCTVNTIYFWPAPLEALHQIHRVLKPEGTLVICFNPRNVMEHQGKIIHHGFTLYHPEEVAALLTEAGFRHVQLYYRKNRFGECAAARGIK
ncbi:MAG: class I SAM-dependent methyltransferase, partial [Ignavibacteriae bacterium]